MRPEHWLYTIPLRLRSLFRRAQTDQELDDELRDHVERKTQEYIAKGLVPEEARRQAPIEMGGIEKRKEECRDVRRVRWLQNLAHLVRAGRERFAGLNEALDLFLAKALARNLPVTLVNHATGPHAFDLDDDSENSREVVKQILAFMRFHLQVAAI
jgi:hypothetical protein